MKRERMRARGPRGTRGLVEMVRDQVAELVVSGGKMAKSIDSMGKSIDVLSSAVVELRASMVEMRAAMGDMRQDIGALGGMMTTLAEAGDDHEARLTAHDARLAALEDE